MSSFRLARISHFTIPLKQILYKQAPNEMEVVSKLVPFC
jgi:hypothetical protein